jgi:hypothetical protein
MGIDTKTYLLNVSRNVNFTLTLTSYFKGLNEMSTRTAQGFSSGQSDINNTCSSQA